MTKVQYQIKGMTCTGCVKRVNQVLQQYAEEATVTLEPPLAILINPKVDLQTLNNKLSEVGQYVLSLHQPAPKSIPTTADKGWWATYRPLLTVLAYLLIVTVAIQISHGEFVFMQWMQHFMAGFFLVFSFFKLLDLQGFADSYAMYDCLAKHWAGYGLIYPFIELAFGIWYLLDWLPQLRNWLTLIVMGFSTIGVILAVMNRQQIRCACLGTGFNLPMSTVTIIEDLSMVLMAAWMIISAH